MPQRLQARKQKIQAKRKQTPWRDFVMEIASRAPLSLYNNNGSISRFPETSRIQRAPVSEFAFVEPAAHDGSLRSEDFFAQFGELLSHTPLPDLFGSGNNENGAYADNGGYSKNVYLSFIYGPEAENVAYSRNTKFASNTYNSAAIWKNSQNIYQSSVITTSHNVFYSRGIEGSSDIWFSSNLVGCQECMFCQDLSNQQYMIHNEHYTPHDYEEKKRELLSDKSLFDTRYEEVDTSIQNKNCTDVEDCFGVFNIKSARNVMYSGGATTKEHFYDVVAGGILNHFYGVYQGVYFSEHIYCSAHINKGTNIFYSYYLKNCSYCLGCVGLQGQSYCIFNQQYTKAERHDAVDKIFAQMEMDGMLGQFFPGSLNPLYFNDTIASLVDTSFTKEEVTTKGYLRRDEPIQVDVPAGATVVKTSDLDQYEGFVISTEVERSTTTRPRFLDSASLHSKGHNEIVWHIDPEILNVIIQDEEGNIYRIIPMEYKFLKKYGLPLPRKHWLQRIQDNFSLH